MMPLSNWPEIIGAQILADAIADRIGHSAYFYGTLESLREKLSGRQTQMIFVLTINEVHSLDP